MCLLDAHSGPDPECGPLECATITFGARDDPMSAPDYKALLDRLVDVEAPPLPKRTGLVMEPTPEQVRGRVIGGLASLAFGAALGLALHRFQADFWAVVGGGLFGFVGIAFLVGRGNKVARCPFCNALITDVADNLTSPRAYRCTACGEYSSVEGRVIRAHDPSVVADKPTFAADIVSPLVFPRGCVQCGAPPTRLDELKSRDVKAAHLVVGRVRVETTTLRGVPYCADHADAVSLDKLGGKPVLLWRSLAMMRKFLHANRPRAERASA